MTRRMRSGSHSTKSSETNSRELGRVETGMSVRTTDTNGAPLSTTSLSDQVPKTPQDTDNNEEGEEVDPGRVLIAQRLKASISNGSLRNFSRPTQPEVIETKGRSYRGRSPFRPSAESWADATTEALTHLKATGVLPQVPEVPQLVRKSSLRSIGVSGPSPVSPSQAQVEISTESHFKRVAPGVSLYSPSPSEQNGLTPRSQQIQLHQLSETHSSTPSSGSTEVPYWRSREKKQTRQRRNIAIYSSIPSSDYLAEHEDDGETLLRSRAPSRFHQAEAYPVFSTSRQTGPLGDSPQYAARPLPIPGSISDASPRIPLLSTTKTHEKQESVTSDDSVLNLTRYNFPDAPDRLARLPPAPQHTPRNYRREESVGVVEGLVHESSRDYKRRRDNYPLNPPPYRTAQSYGRAAIASGALYRNQAERDFPEAPRDDPRVDEISSSVSSPAMDTPYRPDPRASPASWVSRGAHTSFLPSPAFPQPRSISPEMDLVQPEDYYDGAITDRRPSATSDDVPRGTGGHSSGFDRRPIAEHVDHYNARRFQSGLHTPPITPSRPREISTPVRPLPPMPPAHRQDELGSRYHGTFEPDQYSLDYDSHPSMRSSIATVATSYDEASVASTARSLSGLSTICDPQNELDAHKLNLVSMRAPYAENNGAFYATVIGECRNHNKGDDTQRQDLLKEHLRGLLEAAEALNHARAGTPGSIHSSNLTNSITPLLKQKFNSIEAPQTQVVMSPIRPTESSRVPNAEEEASLHTGELNVPLRKPLSKMEKALLRRVEFGSHVDHSKLELT